MNAQPSIKLAVDTAPFQHRFLTLFGGLFLILLERGLGQWGLFFDSSPLLSFLIVGYLGLYFPALIPMSTVLILGFFCDVISLDPFGVRTLSLTVFYALVRWQPDPLREEDFITVWAQISLIFMVASLVRLVLYMGLYWSLPDLFALGYQTGITILIFPIFFVTGSFIRALMHRTVG